MFIIMSLRLLISSRNSSQSSCAFCWIFWLTLVARRKVMFRFKNRANHSFDALKAMSELGYNSFPLTTSRSSRFCFIKSTRATSNNGYGETPCLIRLLYVCLCHGSVQHDSKHLFAWSISECLCDECWILLLFGLCCGYFLPAFLTQFFWNTKIVLSRFTSIHAWSPRLNEYLVCEREPENTEQKCSEGFKRRSCCRPHSKTACKNVQLYPFGWRKSLRNSNRTSPK